MACSRTRARPTFPMATSRWDEAMPPTESRGTGRVGGAARDPDSAALAGRIFSL